jgi:hypothetical protein
VDVDGRSLLVGLATGRDTSKGGRFTFGGFIEGGWGNYDSSGNFGGVNAYGEGDTSYYGIGALLRLDKTGNEKGHLYQEASLRLGQVKNDFSGDLLNNGTNVLYDSKAIYYGFHLGIGYIKNLREGKTLDLYSKLLYVRQGSDSVTLSSGDPVNFKAITSFRWRNGVRYTQKINEYSKFHAGLAYDYEFGGKARATTYGVYNIDAPSIKGGSGVAEIGLSVKQSPDSKFSLDFKLEGYTGKREGMGGGVQFNWVF